MTFIGSLLGAAISGPVALELAMMTAAAVSIPAMVLLGSFTAIFAACAIGFVVVALTEVFYTVQSIFMS